MKTTLADITVLWVALILLAGVLAWTAGDVPLWYVRACIVLWVVALYVAVSATDTVMQRRWSA